MQTSPQDHPDVIVFPPVILAATVLLACILQWLFPLGELEGVNQTLRILAGVLVFLTGIAFAATGHLTLVRAGTNVSPLLPTTALATNGIYRWTRNPLYTGGTFLMIGIAFVFALDWLLLLIAPSMLVLHFGVVRREERYLEGKFGDSYLRYKANVARYGFGI
jgi:protein-S-isoprenylcysteine O-methyltransferase Ste14